MKKMTSITTERRVAVLVSLQRALLGAISSRLRAVLVQITACEIAIHAIFDGALEDNDLEAMSCVESEVMADFSDTDKVSVECARVDAPDPIERPGIWVFQRREE